MATNRLTVIKIIRKLIINNKIGNALKVLYQFVEGHDRELESDLVLLQSKFKTNEEQYEIKQIITKQEYDLERSKIVLALENLLDKLPQESNIDIPEIEEDIEKKAPISGKWLIGLILIGLLICVGIFINVNNRPQNQDKTQTSLTDKNESFLYGQWSAKVTKQGYYVERGLKKIFENATAFWRVNVSSDHTMTMQGTVDTTGISRLRWVFDKDKQTLTIIQEDGYAFDAKVEVNESERQVWRTVKQEANKVDEWVWELTR